MRFYHFILGCSLGVALTSPALAQRTRDPCDGTMCAGDMILPVRRILDEEITVLASGNRLLVEDAGQSIAIVGTDELDSIQSHDLTSALERLPGVTLTRNGGPGGFTGMRVRGAASEQLLVLIDGIRVADVASPGGGYDLGTLSSGGIGKIELLRGSNSVVWGSEAIGGVLALTSRRFEGVEASAEYGARDTFDGQLGAGIVEPQYEATINAGYSRTDGFSRAASGTEPDGYRQWRVNGSGLYRLSETMRATVAGRYADSRLDYDGSSFTPPYGLIDTPEYTESEEWSARAGLVYEGPKLQLDAGYSIYDIARANYNPDFGPDPSFAAKGRQNRAELKGVYGDTLNGAHVYFGADREWERFSTTFDARRKASTTSGYAMLGYANSRLNLYAGARIDDHSGFGSQWTFGANGAYQFADGWRVRASYGEGFKAPTLYQLYSDFGDDMLKPESSRSYGIGVERGTRNDYLHMAITLFRRDSRNLIDFAACVDDQCLTRPFGLYQNVGKARAEGFEVQLGARLSDRFRAQAAYSYAKSKDRSPGGFNEGNDLARRPRHAVTVALDWDTPLAGLSLGADLRMVGESFDDAGNFTRLDGYGLGTVRASLPVSDAIELFGRVENVTDEQYQVVSGYATPGRSAYFGARARF